MRGGSALHFLVGELNEEDESSLGLLLCVGAPGALSVPEGEVGLPHLLQPRQSSFVDARQALGVVYVAAVGYSGQRLCSDGKAAKQDCNKCFQVSIHTLLYYLSFGSYKMKLNRELSLLCRLEVKHCVLDDSFGC